MTRKGPKRAAEEHAPPTTERVVELAEMIIKHDFELGPLDQEDLREALCELIHRRNIERLGPHPGPLPMEAAA